MQRRDILRNGTAGLATALAFGLAGCGDDSTGEANQPTDIGTPETAEPTGGSDPSTATDRFDQTRTPDRSVNYLETVSVTGAVQDGEEVSHVEMVAKKPSGSGDVDLREVTVAWVESGGTYELVHESVDDSATNADGRFRVESFKDSDGSAPELNDPDDRFTLTFDIGDPTTEASAWTQDPGTYTFADPLEAGELVAVKLTTSSGGAITDRLIVPQSLSGTEAVSLSSGASAPVEETDGLGEDSKQRVTKRIEVTGATGAVRDESEISHVSLTVKKVPGASNVDLSDLTAAWVESGGTFRLVHDSVPAGETDADGRFRVDQFKDGDDSAPVLNDPDDRLSLVFDLGDPTTEASEWTQNPETFTFSDSLGEGEIVTIKLNTRSGGSTTVRLVVPQSLSGTEAVNL